jgi:prepilin signal peptidase PulO-like enzyme (type II secretory pathway)
MGFGDVKYAFFMGLLLGYPVIIVGLYTAFLTGALVGVILIIAKKRKFGQIIPFGPFLVLGTVVAMFWGNQLLNWLWHYL